MQRKGLSLLAGALVNKQDSKYRTRIIVGTVTNVKSNQVRVPVPRRRRTTLTARVGVALGVPYIRYSVLYCSTKYLP